jgi:PAS domain-containing protein
MFDFLPELFRIPLAFGIVVGLLVFTFQSRRDLVSRWCYEHLGAAQSVSEAPLRLAQQVGGIAGSDRAFSQTGLRASEGFARRYGLPPGQTHLSEEEWLALVHPEVLAQLDSEMRDLRAPDGPVASRVRIPTSDGSARWISMRAEVSTGRWRLVRVTNAEED